MAATAPVLAQADSPRANNGPIINENPAASDFLVLQRRIAEIYRENERALVRVKASAEADVDDGGDPQVSLFIGSGFFISRKGHILTTARVVREANRVWVEHRGVAYAAELLGMEELNNVALIRVLNLPPDSEFDSIPLPDAQGLPGIGTMAIRISMPLEFPPTPKLGMISGHESSFARRIFPCKYLRTDIMGGPGEDGAPVLDLSGRLVGVQVGTILDVPGSYCLPARAALRLRDDLLFSGEVVYGWIGFELTEESTAADGKRVVMGEIIPGTPAEEAGMRVGDQLLEIGGYPIASVSDVRNAVFYTRVGQFVSVRLRRDGRVIELSTRVAARPADEPFEVPERPDSGPGITSPFREGPDPVIDDGPVIPVPEMERSGSGEDGDLGMDSPIPR